MVRAARKEQTSPALELEKVAAPVDPTRVGGRYRIEDALAEGGMGAVYRVVDERTGEELALKRLHAGGSRHDVALFEREYRTLAGIQHPRIVRAFDYGVDDSGPYYTMELAPGRDLHELAPLPAAEAFRHLRDVATCLALLHTRRLVHRDVTPRNVRILADGDCKLIDFGALTSFGIPDRVVGTPPCLPPEALKRAPLDQRADIFSLGALLYWALTRKHAYPARRIEDLPEVWRKRPIVPSALIPSLSKQVDTLVLDMLRLDPLARPSSMIEVVERLTAIGRLPPEDEATQRALAESYLVHASFVGRDLELESVRADLAGLAEGRGSATLIMGPSGVGRSRLLREVMLHGQVLGVPAIHIDAGQHRQASGTALAIVHRLLDASPAAQRVAELHASTLAQLDRELAERLGVVASAPKSAMSGDFRARTQEVLLAIVTAACNEKPLLLSIDDVDEADEGSLATIAGLLRLSSQAPLALITSARSEGDPRASMSWRVLLDKSKVIALTALSDDESLALVRSLFGEAPNVQRFAEWLHESTGGSPLHAMELVRSLHASGGIRYMDGFWTLPAERPAELTAEGLDELLAHRLRALSPGALALAEALAVQRGDLSRERCSELARLEAPDKRLMLLDELVRAEVLEDLLQGYRFTHAVLRDVLLRAMGEERRKQLHLRCAEWELQRAGGQDPMSARIEAGWHLLQAGEASRGADLLAGAAYDTVGVRFAFADLQVAAPALEAALQVYTKERRPLHERLPLMAALAQAGYYENYVWGERYGEAALRGVRNASGLTLAAKLQPWLGKTLGLVCALLVAFLRFTFFTKKRKRRYGFADVLVQLFGVVTTLTGAASIALDVEKAKRIAATLDPFLHLPDRLTPVGIAQFCNALKEIGRENQASALRTYEVLLARFDDKRYYPTLPKQARPLYVGGLWFARGVFETMRDGRGALDAADALDRLDLKLYRMIASSLRSLHYAYRGQLEQARKHREQVEAHAIQIGSAWQVELWEPAALILAYATLAETEQMRRVADRLATLAKTHPSLALHAELAQLAFTLAREDDGTGRNLDPNSDLGQRMARVLEIVNGAEPRSFIGWGAAAGYSARALNAFGRHAEAKELCERVLSHLGPEDRAFVALFLGLELELAVADAALGNVAAGRARLDDLLAFHGKSDNPLTRGRIHEAYARLGAQVEDWTTFRHHVAEARRWYRSTGTPALIARIERLQALDRGRSVPPASGGSPTRRAALATSTSTKSQAENVSEAVSGSEEAATVALQPETAESAVTRAEKDRAF